MKQAEQTKQKQQTWVTQGFEGFREGTFGNAGQNLYVSKAGVLQRIHLFDFNKDGYVDLLFCNAQEHLESPPAYVYSNVLNGVRCIELPSGGSPTGAVADLNGDGYDELLLGMEKSGNAGMFNAFIYYGAPEGLSERYFIQVPAHGCTSVTIGDFNGDGRPDLALITQGRLRLFYQSEYTFEPKVFVDHDIRADQIGAADLDGDGYGDLIALFKDAPPRIYWGGPDGIDPDRFTEVPVAVDKAASRADDSEVSDEERIEEVSPLAKVVELGGVPHVFVALAERVLLLPVGRDRSFGEPLQFNVRGVVSVAHGDINANGHTDLVFAGRDQDSSGRECSWVYWGSDSGFDEPRRTALPSCSACDVAIGDLSANGFGDIALCQTQQPKNFSIDSLVFRGTADGIDPDPVRLSTHGARRVFVARTSDDPLPQLIFVNQRARNGTGDVYSYIYYGGADGFHPDRVAKLFGRGTSNAVVCDTNDDGWADIVLVNSAENALHLDPGSFLYLGGPNGFSAEPAQVIPTRKGWHVGAADLNRDGYLDLVFSMFHDPRIMIVYGSASGFDVEHPECFKVFEGSEVGLSVRKIFLADFNNDGYLDLVVANAGKDRVVILWGGPDGFKIDRRLVLPTSHGAGDPIGRDLTGNGYLDLLIGGGKASMNTPHNSFLHIFWNGPDGLRPDRQTQLPTEAAIGMTVADFNNDGHPDIFCCSYKSAIDRDIDAYIYWGGPGGSYSAKNRSRIRAHSSAGCIAADFNEDGYIDLAIANHKTFGDHKGESFVLYNGPDGFDEKNPTRLPTWGPHGMLHAQPGNIADFGPLEYYTSAPFKLPDDTSVTRIGWQAELAPKTWVQAQLRFATRSDGLDEAAWIGPGPDDGDNGWYKNDEDVEASGFAGQWVQYRLALGSTNSGNTPRVTQVAVSYG